MNESEPEFVLRLDIGIYLFLFFWHLTMRSAVKKDLASYANKNASYI